MPYSSVPVESEILVPETLLKKRKSQEKERESRAADLKKKREVRYISSKPTTVMIQPTSATRPPGRCCR